MASGLVRRYALLAGTPLQEAEKLWRGCKREAKEAGRKNDWPTIINNFRERLHLTDVPQLVYFDAQHEVKILSETPDFLLVEFLQPTQVEKSIQTVLERSAGVMTVGYAQVSASIGAAPILNETMSMDVGFAGGSSKTGATSWLMPGLRLKHNGKAAVVRTVGSKRTKISYLDDQGGEMKEESEVDNDELSSTSLIDRFVHMWDAIVPEFQGIQRQVLFEEMVKADHRMSDLPSGFGQRVAHLAQQRKQNQQATEGNFVVTEDDWRIVFDNGPRQSKEKMNIPLPRKPIPLTAPADATDQTQDQEPAGSGIRTPSTHEIKNILHTIRQESKALREGKSRSKLGGKGVDLKTLDKEPTAPVAATGKEAAVEQNKVILSRWDKLGLLDNG